MQRYDEEVAEAVRRRILLPACNAIETHLRLEHHASLVRPLSTQHRRRAWQQPADLQTNGPEGAWKPVAGMLQPRKSPSLPWRQSLTHLFVVQRCSAAVALKCAGATADTGVL